MFITLVTDLGHGLQDQKAEGVEIPLDIKRRTYKVGIELHP
jgi:hypothetical protein